MTQANTTENHAILTQSTAMIVSAYMQNHTVNRDELDALMSDVYSKLASFAQNPEQMVSVMHSDGKTAQVSIEDSVQPDHIICLEDGKKLKMLKRYLKTNYNMTPEEYRKRWNLPASYPMVAPEYAKRRSQLAKDIGLGKESTRVSRMNNAASKRANQDAMA